MDINIKIWEANYKRLSKILNMDVVDFINKNQYMKLKKEGYMDLNIDVLGNNKIAIAHNYIQNGDSMCDPDMQIEILKDQKMIRAYTFQNDGIGIYQESLIFENNKLKGIRKKLFGQHNRFLSQWLKNIKNQGHKPVETIKRAE